MKKTILLMPILLMMSCLAGCNNDPVQVSEKTLGIKIGYAGLTDIHEDACVMNQLSSFIAEFQSWSKDGQSEFKDKLTNKVVSIEFDPSVPEITHTGRGIHLVDLVFVGCPGSLTCGDGLAEGREKTFIDQTTLTTNTVSPPQQLQYVLDEGKMTISLSYESYAGVQIQQFATLTGTHVFDAVQSYSDASAAQTNGGLTTYPDFGLNGQFTSDDTTNCLHSLSLLDLLK